MHVFYHLMNMPSEKELHHLNKKWLNKIEHWFRDTTALITATEDMIRKRKSHAAIQIRAGNIPVIVKTARDTVGGYLGKNKKDFCKQVCQFLDGMDTMRDRPKTKLEVLFAVIDTALSYYLGEFVDAVIGSAIGLILALIWLYKQNLLRDFCKCYA